MNKEPPLPKEIWELAPPVVQGAIWVLVERLEGRMVQLEEEVAGLKAQLHQHSRNSSRPPSSDPPHFKRPPPRQASGRKRGAQPGHPRHERSLVPAEGVSEMEEYKPKECRRCGWELAGNDPEPYRHQVIELKPIEPYVSEYRLHRLRCERCGRWSRAPLPHGVPRGSFGPRLHSIVALCSGAYRMSKRKVASLCADVLGVEISLGEICQVEKSVGQALQEPVSEARRFVQSQATNVDETCWPQGGKRVWLWVAVTSWVSVFFIRLSRGAKVLKEIVGEGYEQVVSSDRAKAYNCHPPRQRQLCWAHLKRDFQAMVDRGGPGAAVGRRLLEYTEVLFGWWYWVRDGTWARSTFKSYIPFVRGLVHEELEAGAVCACPKTRATCRELLKVEQALWTFVRVEGLEPTNNAAERALRHGVLWRKTSYGTQSERGSEFVEHILTVVATCRQQDRPVLHYLTQCCQAFHEGTLPPSLLPTSPIAFPIPKVA